MYVMAMGHAVAPILLVLNLEVLLGAMLETHRETVKAVRKRETMIRVNNQRKPLKISEKDLADKLSHTTSKKEAAKALGVSVATVYRAMRRAS
jgi:transcriptional regulator with PAS, ATPase and Fis domain